jgi:hypothetical protein
MGTKVVRMLEQDVERVVQSCGLPEQAPFATKVSALLHELERREAEADQVRTIIRQELERLVGGEACSRCQTAS